MAACFFSVPSVACIFAGLVCRMKFVGQWFLHVAPVQDGVENSNQQLAVAFAGQSGVSNLRIKLERRIVRPAVCMQCIL